LISLVVPLIDSALRHGRRSWFKAIAQIWREARLTLFHRLGAAPPPLPALSPPAQQGLLLLAMAPLAALARVEATGSTHQVTPALRSLQRFASAVRIKRRPPH